MLLGNKEQPPDTDREDMFYLNSDLQVEKVLFKSNQGFKAAGKKQWLQAEKM